MAKNHYNKEQMLDWLSYYNDYAYPISMPLKELQQNYTWSEHVNLTVPVAIRCFLDSHDYESCLRNCLSLDCDMDTFMAVAGGIAESYYGTTGMDNKSILKKYLDEYLYSLVEDIL